MTTLAQIVAALAVTYEDQGVAVWLAARNRGLGGAAPIDVIARDPSGVERVADLVRAIGDADPRLFTMRETFGHCPHCRRPVPHNEAEARACRSQERDDYVECRCIPLGSLNEPGRHVCGRYK